MQPEHIGQIQVYESRGFQNPQQLNSPGSKVLRSQVSLRDGDFFKNYHKQADSKVIQPPKFMQKIMSSPQFVDRKQHLFQKKFARLSLSPAQRTSLLQLRPESRQLQPWQEKSRKGSIEDKFESFIHVDDMEEDSCEAIADEQESMVILDDFDEAKTKGVGHQDQSQRWDYFSGKDKSESDSDEESKNFSSANLDEHIGVQRHFHHSNRKAGTTTKNRFVSPSDNVRDAKRTSMSMYRPTQSRKLCELLRSQEQIKPSFIKQNSKVDQNSPQQRQPRYTFNTPGSRPSIFNDNYASQNRQRFTMNLSPDNQGSFIMIGGKALHEKHTLRQSESVQPRLSVQRIPASCASQASLFGNRPRISSAMSPDRTAYGQQFSNQQQQRRIKIMADDQQRNFYFDQGANPNRGLASGSQGSSARPHHMDTNLVEQQTGRILSPQGRDSLRPMSQSVINENVVQIDDHYFDHMGQATESISSTENEVHIIRSLNGNDRRQATKTSLLSNKVQSSQGGRGSGASRKLDDITERSHDKSAALSLIHNRMNMPGHDYGWQWPDDPAVYSDVDKNVEQPIYIMKQNFRKSVIEGSNADFMSSMHDNNSNRNLISPMKQRTPNQSVLTPHITPKDGNNEMTPSADLSSSIHMPTPQKPIVPKWDYIQDNDTQMRAKQTQMMAKNPPQLFDIPSPKQEGTEPALNWWDSLGLSVSNLFTGPATDPKDRRMSTTGEVPDDEEKEDEEPIESANIDVVNEKTRVHSGNTIRKKILFMQSSVTKKGSVLGQSHRDGKALQSLKASLISAQSYNQIESGSDNEDKQDKVVKDQENAISYTTSKQGNTPVKGKINQINLSKNFKKREHSSSVQEPVNSLAVSWTNLASNLMSSQKKRDSSVNEEAKSLSQESVEDKTKESNEKQSRFGMLSMFFDRVTKSNKKGGNNDEDEDLLAPHLDSKSPLIQGGKKIATGLFADKTDESQEKPIVGRKKSQTVYLNANERKPLIEKIQTHQNSSQPEEKLKQIDNIVFNQDRSHFAVIWTDGGFTKYDASNFQVVQRVIRTPPHDIISNQDNDFAEEITLENATMANTAQSGISRQSILRNRLSLSSKPFGKMKISTKVLRKSTTEAEEVIDDQYATDNESDSDDTDDADKEQFLCIALQHRTKDYFATLVRNPSMVIFVHIQDDNQNNHQSRNNKQKTNTTAAKRRIKSRQLGHRSHVKHFQEDVSQIEVLPGARYTLICLKSAIYVYSKNGRSLYDIVSCSTPLINSSICKSFENKLVLAYLNHGDQGESVMIHDYSVSQTTTMDTVYTIDKPYGAGYKVGGVQLDEIGQRITVVSADGCYVYFYILSDDLQMEEEKPVGQDQASPTDGVTPNEQQDDIAAPTPSSSSFYSHQVKLVAPQQSFARSSSSCKAIYLPIQIIEGFSVQDHPCDFILLSSSSMTSHLFALKNDEELAESHQIQKESWTFSRFLPQSLSLERSKIRLNIDEELIPPKQHTGAAPDGRLSVQPNAAPIEMEGENVYKNNVSEQPYTCFVESTGMLVVISHSGYCCKFSIDLQPPSKQSDVDKRYAGFNSVRASRVSPVGRMGSLALSQVDLSQSLAQLKEVPKSTKRMNSRGKIIPNLEQMMSSQIMGTEINLQNVQSITSSTNYQASTKRATAFSGYRQPIMRFQPQKIPEFFVKIDQKADSLRRIAKRKILIKKTKELKERAQFLSKLQRSQRMTKQRSEIHQDRGSKLKKLLRGNSVTHKRLKPSMGAEDQ